MWWCCHAGGSTSTQPQRFKVHQSSSGPKTLRPCDSWILSKLLKYLKLKERSWRRRYNFTHIKVSEAVQESCLVSANVMCGRHWLDNLVVTSGKPRLRGVCKMRSKAGSRCSTFLHQVANITGMTTAPNWRISLHSDVHLFWRVHCLARSADLPQSATTRSSCFRAALLYQALFALFNNLFMCLSKFRCLSIAWASPYS